MRPVPVKPIALFLLLCGAGFLGNWFKLPLFFNVDFLFGSFFVMLAVVRFGTLPALLVGVAAASCTHLLWNHPWAIVIFSAEALWVALWHRRRPGHLVVQDALFWLCLGMPLVWLFYHAVMGMPPQATLLVALKQSINGIVNVLLATLCLAGLKLAPARDGKGKTALLSMQEILFTAFVSATLLPALIYLAVDVRGRTVEDAQDISRRVRSVADGARDILTTWLAGNHQTVFALAELIGDPNGAAPDDLRRRVEALHRSNANLKRLAVIDGNDTLVALSADGDELGPSTLGQSVADLPFVRTARATRQPLIADVVRGRIGQPGPRLALVVPLIDGDDYRGLCVGSVDVERLTERLRILVENRFTDIIVLDREERVVLDTSGLRQALEPFERPPGETLHLAEDLRHWLPDPGRYSSIMLRWQHSRVVKETALSAQTPWTIIVESSPVPYLTQLNQHTIDMLLLLWGIVLLTLSVSLLLSFGIARGLRRLAAATAELPRQLDGGAQHWPTSNIKELHSLIGNFKAMSGALSAYFQELWALNQTLEARVEERTAALRETERLYRRVVDTANEGIWMADRQLVTTYVNRRLAEMLDYPIEEMVGRPIRDFIAAEQLDDYDEQMQRRMLGHSAQFERRMRRRDGTGIWLSMSAAPMLDDEQRFFGTFAMCADISERKKSEEALARQQSELEALNRSLEARIQLAVAELRRKDQMMITQSGQAAMGEMINNIAHQWRQPLNALGLLLSDLQDAHAHNELDQAYLQRAADDGNRLVQQMSTTINDFRSFFRPDKESVDFSALRQIAEAVALVEASFRSRGIALRLDSSTDAVLHGFPNEYSQVLLNLFSNAKDAIVASGAAAGVIDIRLEIVGDQGRVVVADSGGGIPEAIMSRIFEPYFSSKPMGTGIGLYMSKMIIERNMRGRIMVRNHDGGAEFTVSTPLAKEAL